MKTTFEPDEIELIARKVAEIIRPMIVVSPALDDPIFTVDGLASYLQTTPKWIYNHIPELPYFKLDGLLRFRKSDIDKMIKGKIP